MAKSRVQRDDEFRKEQARIDERQKTQGRFEGMTWVTGQQLDQRRNAAAAERQAGIDSKNAIALEKTRQAGGLAIADRNQVGQTTRTGMTETGATNRRTAQLGQQQSEFNRTQALAEMGSAYKTNALTGETTYNSQAFKQLDQRINEGRPQVPQSEIDRIEGGGTMTKADGTEVRVDGAGNLTQTPVNTQTSAETPVDGQRKVSTRIPENPNAPVKKPIGYDFINSRGGYLFGLKGASEMAETFNRNLMSGYRGVKKAYDWLKQPAR